MGIKRRTFLKGLAGGLTALGSAGVIFQRTGWAAFLLPPKSKNKGGSLAARDLVASFLKDPVEAKAFQQDVDKFLASRGITISEEDKIALKSIIESWQPTVLLAKNGGHTNLDTHTNYNASDGHVDRTSHTNHTSSY